MDLLIFLLNILAFLWLFVGLPGILIPIVYGLPPTPTRRERIRKALQMAELQPGETLYDLGSGDGRVLIIAAREFGASAVGIDIGPVQCLQAWAGSILKGSGNKVKVKWGNFLKTDISQADVVFAYLTSSYVERLAPRLISQLKPGARVVTISFDFTSWEPAAFDDRELIFLYRMPPTMGSLGTYLQKRADHKE
jgi:ubiquinone/menaquinone biosynthesis C-methylase UbiE